MLHRLLLDLAAVVVFLALLLKLFERSKSPYSRLPYPPGPKRKLLLDNAFDIPRTQAAQTYARWAQKYNSDILHACAFGTHFIIIINISTAMELLERRSSTFSDRPKQTMAGEPIGYEKWALGLMPYGKTWRDCRKFGHQHLQPQAVQMFRPKEILAIRGFIRRLVASPGDYATHLAFMAAEVSLGVAYGMEPKSQDDYFFKLVQSANESLVALEPGAFFVDMVPLLKYIPAWFPGAAFQRKAKKWRALIERVYAEPFQSVKAEIASGKHVPKSMASTAIASAGPLGLNDYDEWLATATTGTIFQAGAETTSSIMQGFLLAMVLYPEVQRYLNPLD